MLHLVLVHPQIPQNTGNIARLSVATDSELHLVGELGFSLEDKYVRRAGLDYWPDVRLHVHATLDECLAGVPREDSAFFSARAERLYTHFSPPGADAWLVFGREADGLPKDVLAAYADRLYRIPTTGRVRSLNLANAVAIAAYEVLRRQGFPHAG